MNTCDLCGFLAKSEGGLKLHKGKGKCLRDSVAHQASVEIKGTDELPLVDRIKSVRQCSTILKRIPKGARPTATEKLTTLVRNCVIKNDTESWSSLLLFSYTAFNQPKRCSKDKRSLTSIVKNNVIFSEENTPRLKIIRQDGPSNSERALRRIVEGKLNGGDIKGAVRILSSDDGLAPTTDDTIEALRLKHPAEHMGATYPPDPTAEDYLTITEVTKEEVLSAITSFPNDSAGGLDGLRPQHLKDLLGGLREVGQVKLAEALADLAMIMLAGRVPPDIRPILYGASLTALAKNDGGVRPIAVGNTLRRVVGKIVCSRIIDRMGSMFRPQQLGCGTKGGAEAAVHAARCFIGQESEHCQVLLKLDFKNAFNTVYRDKLLQEVKEVLPEYYPYIWQMYRFESHLVYGAHNISSSAGVQQGDPLAPLLFCLVTTKLSKSLASPFNAWYLDDGAIGGEPAVAFSDLIQIQNIGKDLGLELNIMKCELFVFGGDPTTREGVKKDAEHVFPGLAFPEEEDLILLGAPLTDRCTPKVLDDNTVKIRRLISRLKILQAHHALFLLRNCMCLPKLIYILRSSPCYRYKPELRLFDEMVRNSLTEITNVEMTDATWRQAVLPVSRGGLGVRRAEDISIPAYLASINSVRGVIMQVFPDANIVEISAEAQSLWVDQVKTDIPNIGSRGQQRAWDSPLFELHHQQLKETLLPKDKARLQAESERESGAWLHALPIASLGNFLDNNTLRISIALRLGAKVCQPHTCRCDTIVDELGHHGLSCRYSAGRHSRHAALNDTIKRSLVSAGVPSILEPNGVTREDGKRPDGMTLIPWKYGKALLWDATVVDTLAQSHIAGSITQSGTAANDAERRKEDKYRSLTNAYLFSPVGFETFGPWGASAKDLIREIGSRVMENTGEKRSLEYLRQRISINIKRGNAASVLGTLPTMRGLEEIFYVLNSKR